MSPKGTWNLHFWKEIENKGTALGVATSLRNVKFYN